MVLAEMEKNKKQNKKTVNIEFWFVSLEFENIWAGIRQIKSS